MKLSSFIALVAMICFIICSIIVLRHIHKAFTKSNVQKIDYQLELINQTDVRLMDENGKSLYITTFDSIQYYIEKDNL